MNSDNVKLYCELCEINQNYYEGGCECLPCRCNYIQGCKPCQRSGPNSPGSFKSKYCNQIHPKTGSYTKYDFTIWDSVIKKRDNKFEKEEIKIKDLERQAKRMNEKENIKKTVGITKVVDNYAQLKLEHEELKEQLANIFYHIEEVMDFQANMQAVNLGLNLKHPK